MIFIYIVIFPPKFVKSEFDSLGPVKFGNCKRAIPVNYFMLFMCAGSQKEVSQRNIYIYGKL